MDSKQNSQRTWLKQQTPINNSISWSGGNLMLLSYPSGLLQPGKYFSSSPLLLRLKEYFLYWKTLLVPNRTMRWRTMLKHRWCCNLTSVKFLFEIIYAMTYILLAMLNDNFFPGIIGLKPGNNGYTFWELRNRIIGNILSIIASCLSIANIIVRCF